MSHFLTIPESQWVASNEHAFAIRDGFPVNLGHTLIISKRQVASWFFLTEEERQGVMNLVEFVKHHLDSEFHPDSYNIGINDGPAAGQTIPHVHVHLIPRFIGDVDDPTGGVRFVIPENGNYKRSGFIPTIKEQPEFG